MLGYGKKIPITRVHLDPAIRDVVLEADPIFTTAALEYTGLGANNVRHVHFSEQPERYKRDVESEIDYDLGKHIVVGLGKHISRFRDGRVPLNEAQNQVNAHIFTQLALTACPPRVRRPNQPRRRPVVRAMASSVLSQFILADVPPTERIGIATLVGTATYAYFKPGTPDFRLPKEPARWVLDDPLPILTLTDPRRTY